MEKEDLLYSLAVKKFGSVISEDENTALQKILASDVNARLAFGEMQRIWESSKTLKRPVQDTADSRWQKLREKTQATTIATATHQRSWLRYAATIAAIMIAAGLYLYNRGELITVAAIEGKTKTTRLPDGSTVTLNTGSQIEYDASDWQDERKVLLSGEGFFEVTKAGTTFVVESENARITVLGTSFNIQTRAAKTTVSCVTGKVSVDNKSKSGKVLLTPGLGATVTGDLISEVYAVDTEGVVAWMNEGLDFRNTSLATVFQSLESHYNTVIIVKRDVDSLTFTGNLESGSLAAALKTICLSAGLSYSVRSDSTILIE